MILIRGACLLGLIVCLSSCTGFSKKNKVVLKIQNHTWSVKDLEIWFEKYLQGLDSFEKESGQQVESLKDRFISDFIFQKILENWIKRNDIKIAVQNQKNSQQAVKNPLLQERQMYQLMHGELIKHLLNQIPAPSQAAQLQFYRKNKRKFFQPDSCLVEEIRVSSKNLAERLKKDIASPSGFKKMGEIYSPNLAAFWINSSSNKAFKDVCSKKVGFISPVIQSSFGWHILLIKKRKKAYQKTFKQSQTDIIKHLKNPHLPAELEKWLKKEISQTNVFIDKKILDKIIIQYKR